MRRSAEEAAADPMSRTEELRATLLAWYDRARRDLPWRADPGERTDPYRVWASEVMLQQTRVETVRGYYSRWMERFPTLDALATASQDEVLKMWEGLGYYSRARNFLQAAREVAARYGGEVPNDPTAFRALAGVGRYTAGAVLSIAFGREEPAVDGNVRRVFARWWDEARPSDGDLWACAAALVRGERPGDLNQALMELGATICTPRSPRCDICPVEDHCAARRAGTQAERPERAAARSIPHESAAVAIVRDGSGRMLISRSAPGGRLGGMWGFPSTPPADAEDVGSAVVRLLRDAFGLHAAADHPLPPVEHLFSHVRVTYRPVICRLHRAPAEPLGSGARWVLRAELDRFALPAAQKRIAALLGG